MIAAIPLRRILEMALWGVLMELLVVVTMILFVAARNVYFDAPPIAIKSLDPEPLGVFCGSELVPVHNQVSINDEIIAIYYLTTIDATGANLVGTQTAFTDMQHPHPATFLQELPWQVPHLAAGKYIRSFAARNVEGAQRTVFVERHFEIKGQECDSR